MDVYHKVLLKLYEVSGGSESQAVNFADLVKKEGFHGNYRAIFQELSGQAWISETGKADWVKITHWGIKEAKSAQAEASDAGQGVRREASRLITEARDLINLLENLARENTKENLVKVEEKAADINKAIGGLKGKI